LAIRFVLVRLTLAEASAFGRRVRLVGLATSVDAGSATAVSLTIGPAELAESGAGARRGLAQTGELSAGSNSSWWKIAAGRRTDEDPDVAPSSGISSMSTTGSSASA
jgi:hypothetical protein